MDLQFFDPKQEYSVSWKSLPHWSQVGTICFITWRTADSLPAAVVKRLSAEREDILQRFGLDPKSDLRAALAQLPPSERGRAQSVLFNAWDTQLDRGAGECVLARTELAQIVEKSLRHFDGDRYLLSDFVVMPNHVHVLVAFRDENSLLKQCTSWKRFTGQRIQASLGRHGPFWQVEQFDHLVRSEEQFVHLRRYIAENPKKAKLREGTYRHYSKKLN